MRDRPRRDAVQVRTLVKYYLVSRVVKYHSAQALVSSLFSSPEVGGQVLGWVEAVAAR